MEPEFWHNRWSTDRIAFHEGHPNALLTENFYRLSLEPHSRLFLPLCGKTTDISWLLKLGYRIAGAELSRSAIEQLFDDLDLAPEIVGIDGMLHFKAPLIDIFVGDIFDLTTERLGAVDAVYDRAALVALPSEMRQQYATHLARLTARARQLLICFEYDQNLTEGPPFSVTREEVTRLYGDMYDLHHLVTIEVEGGLKGVCPATETAWLLQ